MLDPRRLLTFREVALAGSFSRAAAALSLTQPAVSQQMRALELQVGARLIDRGHGTFALTPAGELLLRHADAVHDRLRLAESQLAEVVDETRRQLRLAAFPSALATLVPDAIVRLGSELEVSATQGSTGEIVAAVLDGRAHVGLCFQDASLPRREHDGTRRVDVLEESMIATVGHAHRLAERKRIRLHNLARDDWLAAVPDGLIVRACRAAGFEPRVVYLMDDPMAINHFVAANLAVTLTSELLAPHFDGVAVLPLLGDPSRRAIYAVL